jgi:hypothetical protein
VALVLGVGLAAAACDQPVPKDGPVPHGEINNDTLQLPPVDTLGGVISGNLDGVSDIVPADCTTQGCPLSASPCYSYYCDSASGQCMTKNNDGVTCDDGNMCTLNDACLNGACSGAFKICPAPDQCHTAGSCNQQTGACVPPAKPDGSTCDDGNACTVSDSCQAGVCKSGTARQCPATDQCHDAGTCTASTGTCTNPIKTNGTTCEDQNACTHADTCQNGVCTGGSPTTCPVPDQCHAQGTCDPTSGTCTTPIKANGTTCNDGLACTSSDMCVNGSCIGAVNCPASDQCHDPGTCTANGCTNPAKANGTTCNDTSLCTTGDMCMNGVCKGTTTVTCPAADQCHDPGVCNDTTGQCSSPVKPVGTTCNDGMLCTYGDACNANGACAGTTVVCMSDDTATRECDGTSTCKVTPKPGAACDDGNPCTRGDVRKMDGTCAGTPYTCDVGPCMTASTCDGQGGCVPTAKADGTACDADNSKCTPHDRCQGGVCVRDPNPVTCVKRDCNTVACNATTGNCDYAPTTGDACGVTGCFSAGTCNAGVCSGTPKDCSSFDGPCTTGICDARTGGCAAEYKSNGTTCDPGGQCVAGAVCAFGICELPPAACPAPSGPCKLSACMPSTGACYETNLPAGTTCDPKTSCMGPGLCDDQGKCVGAPAPNGDSCTLTGGAVGLCLGGSCITSGGGTPDASTNDAGADPDAGTRMKSADGCGCDVGLAGNGALLPAAVIAAAAAIAAMLRRRRAQPAKTKSRETRRPRAR